MNERLKKLHERLDGKRGQWKPKQPTPAQTQRWIDSQRNPTEADYPPTQKDLKDKENGIVRTTKKRNR